MSPTTHLLASWIVAVKTTDNLRDRALVTWAGVLPDLDGLGLVVDLATHRDYYYPKYHHWLAHGLLGALVCSAILTALGRRRWRVFALCLLTFHLHLLCDFVGSRGPGPGDLWPIYYFGPIRDVPMWIWKHQWPLDGWINRTLTIVLLAWALWLAVKKGDSFIAVFSRRADKVFVSVLRKWANDAGLWFSEDSQSPDRRRG